MTDKIKTMSLLVDKIRNSRTNGKSVLDVNKTMFAAAANLFFNATFDDLLVLRCAANLDRLNLTDGETDEDVCNYTEADLVNAFDVAVQIDAELNDAKDNYMTRVLGGAI